MTHRQQNDSSGGNPENRTRENMNPEIMPEAVDAETATKAATTETAATPPAETAESVRAELMDRILRLQADFDNYRRRTRQEQCDLSAYVTQNLIKDLLPVIDNFERALAAVGERLPPHRARTRRGRCSPGSSRPPTTGAPPG